MGSVTIYYLARDDGGCPLAKGKDGSTATMRGGILRVRPDGTDLEEQLHLALTDKGKIFVVSAGNERTDRIHLGGRFVRGRPRR